MPHSDAAAHRVHCPSCGYAFDPQERESPPAELMEMMPAPRGMTVASEAGGLVITRRWFHPKAFILLGFATIWDGFLVFWYANALAQLGAGHPEALLMVLFPVLHVAAGVYVTWLGLATLLNRTTITCRSGRLRVRHGPLYWPAPGELRTEQLDQLWVVQNQGKKGQISYELHARDRDGLATKLLSGLDDVAQARFVERRLEAELGIDDAPVRGEHTSS